MAGSSGPLDAFVQQLGQSVYQFALIVEEVKRAIEPHLPALISAAHEYAIGDRLKAAGWLPHDLLPIERVAKLNAPKDIGEALEAYFTKDWNLVEQGLRDRYRSVGLDKEALSSMDEALRAHRHGLYRAACRTVFPEIDRVARLRYYGSRRGGASLKELREDFGTLSLRDFGSHGMRFIHAFGVIERISYSHLSEYFGATSAAARYPNRHALVHGYASFSTMKDSVNTLFIADFMFHGIQALEELRQQGLVEASDAEMAQTESVAIVRGNAETRDD